MLLLLLLVSLLLAGCAQDNSELALNYLAALDDGDTVAASQYVCEERADAIASAIVTDMEEANFNFQNVTCSARGDDVSCRFNITQDTAAEETAQQFLRQITFEVEDGKICGFEEEVAE